MENGKGSVENSNGIATITFFHPQSNSLPGALLREIAATIEEIGTREDVRVVVLKSEGEKAFCAGGDVVSLVKSKSAVNSTLRKDFFAEEYALNHLLATMKTPLIAVMDGITSKEGYMKKKY